jgi:hypothetical protein
MEAMLGISLYNYLYLRLAKTAVFLIIPYAFFSTKLKREEQVLPRSDGGEGEEEVGRGQGGEMAQTVYRHMNKCINNKKSKVSKTCLSIHIN